MNRLFILFFTFLLLLSSSVFAMEDYFKDEKYNFKNLKDINLYYIAYERVLTKDIPNFRPYLNPEPQVLDYLTKTKGDKIIWTGKGNSKSIQAFLTVEIYVIGTKDNLSMAEMEFIVRDRKSKDVIYRRRFERTMNGTCEEILDSVCKEFLEDLK